MIKIIIMVALVLTTHVQASQYSYNDPLYHTQWYLNKTSIKGENNYNVGFENLKRSGIDQSIETVTVIFSTGIDYRHEDLVDVLWVNNDEIAFNGIDDDGNGAIDDIHGLNPHKMNGDIFDPFGSGTSLAGVVAASQDNGKGITGIASNNKIISCKLYDEEGSLTYQYLENCVDYVIDLKVNKKLNLSSVLFNFGSAGAIYGQPEPKSFYAGINKFRTILEKLEAEEILLIAPAADHGFGKIGIDLDLDYTPYFPFSFLMSNIVVVSGMSLSKELNSQGENTISTFAPAEFIKTTSNKKRYAPKTFITELEQADIPLDNIINGTLSSDTFTTTEKSWVFNYSTENASLEFPELDLSEYRNKFIGLSFDLLGTESEFYFEFFNHSLNKWQPMTGNGMYYGSEWQRTNTTVYISPDIFLSLRDLKIRLLFHGYPSSEDKEVYVDNIKLFDVESADEVDDYSYTRGSSIAAALVAGSAAVLQSNSELKMSEVRNLLISSGTIFYQDRLDGFPSDLSLSNKYLKLLGDNTGLLDCVDQKVSKRLYPSLENVIPRVLGKELIIKAININCGNPIESKLEIKDELTDVIYEAEDDGIFPDSIPNDGFNITKVVFEETGMHNLRIDSNKGLPVLVVKPYKYFKTDSLVWDVREDSYRHSGDIPFYVDFGGVEDAFNKAFFTGSIGEGVITKFNYSDNELENINKSISELPVNKSNKLQAPNDVSTGGPTNIASQYEIYNRISVPWEEFIKFVPYELDTFKLLYFPVTSFSRVAGEEGERVFVFYTEPSNREPDTTMEFQLLFFEKSSTFVYSYKNFPNEVIDAIKSRGLQIGHNYFLPITDEFENNVSYIFKVDDNVNVAPISITDKIFIEMGDEAYFNINKVFDDADNDQLFYSRTENTPSFLNIYSLGNSKVTFQSGWGIGDEIEFEVQVTDGEQAIRKIIKLQITEKPKIPPVFSLEEVEVNTGIEKRINLSRYTVSEEQVTFEIKNKNENIKLEGNILRLNYSKADYPLGGFVLKLILQDGFHNVEKAIAIRLNYFNQTPELLYHFDNYRVYLDSEFEVDLSTYFDDRDNDTLTYKVDSEFAQLSESNSSTLKVFAKELGVHVMTIEAFDSEGASVSTTFRFDVIEKTNNENEDTIKAEKTAGGGSLAWFTLGLLIITASIRKYKLSKVAKS